MGWLRTGALALAPLTLGAALAMQVGCASNRTPDFGLKGEDPAVLAEALRLCGIAERAQDAGRFEKAADFYKQALTLRKDLGGAWNNFGIALQAQKNYLDGAAAFRRAADLLPSDPRPLENLALVYLTLERDEEALRYYTESLERDPNWLPSLRGVASAVKRLRKSDEVIKDQLRRGMMMETDPAWREVMERQRLRVEQDLREKGKSETGG